MTIEIKISKRPISYDYAMKFLKKRVENLKKDQNKELIWLLEHPTIYTTGIQFNKNHIIEYQLYKLLVVGTSNNLYNWYSI